MPKLSDLKPKKEIVKIESKIIKESPKIAQKTEITTFFSYSNMDKDDKNLLSVTLRSYLQSYLHKANPKASSWIVIKKALKLYTQFTDLDYLDEHRDINCEICKKKGFIK